MTPTVPDDLSDLHPDLMTKVTKLRERAAVNGITFRKTSGARSFARQALFYTTFRRSPAEAHAKYGIVSAPSPMGISRHHPYFEGKSAAADLAVVGANLTQVAKAAAQRLLGRMAEEEGLVWGGHWKTPDDVHFELSGMDTSAEYVKLGERLDRAAGILVETPPLPGGGA